MSQKVKRFPTAAPADSDESRPDAAEPQAAGGQAQAASTGPATQAAAANPFARAKRYHEEAALADRNRVDWDPENEELHYIAGRFHGIREFPSRKLANQPARFAIIIEYDETTGEPTGRAISIPLHTALAARLGPLPAGCFVILEYVGKKLSTSGQAFHSWIVSAFDENGEPIRPEEGAPF